MTGPTKLRYHDDGLNACDVAVAEDLGVWQLVFPSDSPYLSKAAHVELFQDLETRAIRGPRL